MGTRGEIYVRNSSSVIELWRHYDTYANFMVPYFKVFAKYAAWCAGSQRHWLTYPEDVAAMLIAYDYEVVLATRLRFVSKGLLEARPDLKPRGRINDFEKVWILDIPDENQTCDITWKVRGFSFKFQADAEEMREDIRKGKDAMFENYMEKIAEFSVKPLNDEGGGCRLCGYPGPLIIVEDPPVCIYCLLKNLRDDFFKAEIERIVKVAPLITQITR